MSVDFTAGRVRFFNAAGGTTFDSNDRNLLLPSFVHGQITTRAVNTNATGPFVQDDTIVIGACHASAQVTLAFVQFPSGSVYPAQGTVTIYAGTTMIAADGYYERVPGIWTLAAYVTLDIECSGGQVRAIVRYRFPGFSTLTYSAQTIKLFVFAGTFDF